MSTVSTIPTARTAIGIAEEPFEGDATVTAFPSLNCHLLHVDKGSGLEENEDIFQGLVNS